MVVTYPLKSRFDIPRLKCYASALRFASCDGIARNFDANSGGERTSAVRLHPWRDEGGVVISVPIVDASGR